ncbi:MAG: GTP 3',8-cyclase MoaA [Phycisphaerae bacterium]
MHVALPIATDSMDGRPESAQQITGPRHINAVKTLRISVTDRCNFRCVYCMPEDKLDWVPKETLLTFEETLIVARAAQRHGIHAFKITGGEPLVRHDLPRLIAMLKRLPGTPELSMTTNGSLLDCHARPLKEAGLDRLTVSLDTLRPDRFKAITRGAELARVWRGIKAACAAGFAHPKINCVAMRGINDDELATFADLTINRRMTVRFIEYMPLGRTVLGGAFEQRFISEVEIRRRIEQHHGPLVTASVDTGHGPATMYRIRDAKGAIGFISAMSRPFCETCNRLRLTAEGQLRSCLFDGGEIELRPIIRRGPEEHIRDELHAAFVSCVAFKPDSHAYHGNRQMSQIGG